MEGSSNLSPLLFLGGIKSILLATLKKWIVLKQRIKEKTENKGNLQFSTTENRAFW